MKDIFGFDVDKDDFLPPLSEEAAAEVRRLIGGSLQYHQSVSAQMDEEEMEESPDEEQRNLNLYERMNTRSYATAQQAEYARFQRLPKKQRDAEIAKDVEKIRRSLKEKEEWMKTLGIPTDGDDSESESGEEVDDEEEEEAEEDSDESADEGSIDEPGTKAWRRDFFNQMDSAWEEVYAKKINHPIYSRARAYSENSTYEKSEEAKKKKRRTERNKKKKEEKKEKVVEEEEEEEVEVQEELGITVEEIDFDEEDDFDGEKDPEVDKLQEPKMEKEEGIGEEPVNIEWQEVFTDTSLSQKVPTFVVVEEKPSRINIGSQQKPGILKLSQPTDDGSSNVLPASGNKTISVTWDDECFYPVEEVMGKQSIPKVLEQSVVEKSVQVVENQVAEKAEKTEIVTPPTPQSSHPNESLNQHNENDEGMEDPDSEESSTPPNSRPPILQPMTSDESSFSISICDPNDVEENEMNFNEFFDSDFNIFAKQDSNVVAAPEVNRDVTDTVMEEDEMNFNAFFNSGREDSTVIYAVAEEKDTVAKELAPPVTQIATDTVDEEPKSLKIEKEQEKETTVILDRDSVTPIPELPPPVVTQVATDTVMEEPLPVEKELEKHVENRIESHDPDSSLPVTLTTISPQQQLPSSSSRVLRSKSKCPFKIAPKLAKPVWEGRKLPTRQAKHKKEDPPATVAQKGPRGPGKPAQSPAPKKRRTVAPHKTTVPRYATRSQTKNN